MGLLLVRSWLCTWLTSARASTVVFKIGESSLNSEWSSKAAKRKTRRWSPLQGNNWLAYCWSKLIFFRTFNLSLRQCSIFGTSWKLICEIICCGTVLDGAVSTSPCTRCWIKFSENTSMFSPTKKKKAFIIFEFILKTLFSSTSIESNHFWKLGTFLFFWSWLKAADMLQITRANLALPSLVHHRWITTSINNDSVALVLISTIMQL